MQLIDTVNRYEELFKRVGIKPLRHPDNQLAIDFRRELEHCHWMLGEIRKFENHEKAMRWLGFIQGVLWVQSAYTIDDLREHNR